MDKYYLHTTSDITRKYVERNSSTIMLSVSEDVKRPSFDLYLDKLEEGKFKRPQNNTYEKYKEVNKEIYDSVFNMSLNTLNKFQWDDAEYYYDQKSPTWTDLIMYTTDPKNRLCLFIDIRDSVDTLMLMFGYHGSFSHRPSYRKKAISIAESLFKSALKETIKFIEDGNSYHINVTDYLNKIKLFVSGSIPKVQSEKSINLDQLINQLELKKRDIVNRLIENDSDSENVRSSLRGEMDGIEYCLKAIKKFFYLL